MKTRKIKSPPTGGLFAYANSFLLRCGRLDLSPRMGTTYGLLSNHLSALSTGIIKGDHDMKGKLILPVSLFIM